MMNPRRKGWRIYANRLLAAEISSLTRYYDRLVQYARLPNDNGLLFDLVDCAEKVVAGSIEALPDVHAEPGRRDAVLLNGNFNHSHDIQGLLETIRRALGRGSRIVAVVYNPYFASIYRLAARLGLRADNAPSTFVTYTDLENIARLSGFRVVRTRAAVYSPLRLLGFGNAQPGLGNDLDVERRKNFADLDQLGEIVRRNDDFFHVTDFIARKPRE